MRKVVIEKPGGYDRLKVVEAPDPQPGPGEAVVRTEAVAVNFADTAIRMGLYSSAKKLHGFPITPGFEFAGTVEKLGPTKEKPDSSLGPYSQGLAEGDSVLGVSLFGGFASHVVVPLHQIFRRPEVLSVDAAAGFPVVHLTAWYALKELANVRPGRWVLVHSAAGGVGCAAVQVAKLLGCHVVGVVGASHKVETVKQYGADAVVDKSAGELWKQVEAVRPEKFDVVLDPNGRATLWQSFMHLRKPGRLVLYGFATMLKKGKGTPSWPKLFWDYLRTPRFNPIKLVDGNRSVLAFNLSYLFNEHDLLTEGMTQLLEWREAGKLVDPPLNTYSLDDVAKAQRDIEAGQTRGKLILKP